MYIAHLDHGGDCRGGRDLSASLVIQLIAQVIQRASSQPIYLFVVCQHQIVVAAELHAGDPRAGHHLQLPHGQRDVLLTLEGKTKKPGADVTIISIGGCSTKQKAQLDFSLQESQM